MQELENVKNLWAVKVLAIIFQENCSVKQNATEEDWQINYVLKQLQMLESRHPDKELHMHPTRTICDMTRASDGRINPPSCLRDLVNCATVATDA